MQLAERLLLLKYSIKLIVMSHSKQKKTKFHINNHICLCCSGNFNAQCVVQRLIYAK
jgi:hypothetical protein